MDEVVSMVASGARTGVELTAEVLKIIVPALAKGGVKILGAGGKLLGYGISKAAEARNEKQAVGVVPRQQLLEQAAKNNSDVKFTDNFPAGVIDSLAERAKAYQIPVTINGEGANRSISYLERDNDVLAQIMRDWQTEQLTPKEIGGVSRITSFTVGENQIEAMKTELRAGGVDCWFTQRENGEIRCNFKTEDAEKAKIITDNFKKTQNEVAENCGITQNPDMNAVTVSDNRSGKTVAVELTEDMRKEDITAVLREDLGYTPLQADIAANKFAAEVGTDTKFFEPRAEDNLEKLQVNIRYPSDDALLAGVSFSALKFKDGENAHLSVSHGDETVLLSPADLSDEELKTVFTERLGMSEQQAEKAAAKTRKIDAQITGKHRETLFRKEENRSINIEKSSHNSFVLISKDVTKTYDFTQINLEKRISGDFGIPLENAKNIVQKAKSQSVVQNRINSYNERIRKAKKEKHDPFKQKNSEKKVKR